jgi:uncharacterized protein (DUF305 family)
MLRFLQLSRVLVVPFALVFAGACARGGDTAAGDTAAPGADIGGQVGAQPAARDADHEFLQRMSNHHEGLVLMAGEAMNRATASGTKSDAHELHQKQQQERDQMVGMIRSTYNETHTPSVMPEHRAMNDSLQQKSGAAYDRDFYRHVVMHHREGMRMIDEFLPRLTRPDVRQMAEKMKADQTRELAEFERKQSGRSGR